MKKILIIFGTRPEAIKMAPIIKKLRAEGSKLKVVICVTGQHRGMLDQVLTIFDILPDYDLAIMREDQDLFDVTANSLIGLKDVLKNENPDLVLVQGDTTTAFVAALASYYLKIRIAHIEAGLRTYDKYSPYPEEKNRHIISVLVDFHFTPTAAAESNLLKEGIPSEKMWVTGNTVIDALLEVCSRQESESIMESWITFFKNKYNLSLRTNNQKLILITGHRRESLGEGLKNICMALKEIAKKREDVTIVYPVHPNPNVKQPVKAILNGNSNIQLIEPLEYEPFVFLMNQAYIILTDSGGIQEEAPSLGKPVLVMRNTTERPEGIEAGTAKLAGTDRSTIVNEVFKLLDDSILYNTMAKSMNPYGDGKAAGRIVDIIEQVL